MFSSPRKEEIDHRTIKLSIGLIALFFPFVTWFFSGHAITSISASYWEDGLARNFFVGFLFAISAFMIAYNGKSSKEMFLGTLGGAAAFGIAIFPCKCVPPHPQIIPYAHYVFAAVMFSILAYFCCIFYERDTSKGHREALRRSRIYIFCGLVIVASMLIMAIDYNGALSNRFQRLTFCCEAAGLVAFGVSWLTASSVLPGISSQDERDEWFHRASPTGATSNSAP